MNLRCPFMKLSDGLCHRNSRKRILLYIDFSVTLAGALEVSRYNRVEDTCRRILLIRLAKYSWHCHHSQTNRKIL
jgi:hypothetical protein